MPFLCSYQTYSMFNKKQLDRMWVSEMMDGCKNSLDINRYAQFLPNGTFFADIYPMDRK